MSYDLEQRLLFINRVSQPGCPHIPWYMRPILWLFGERFTARDYDFSVSGYHFRGAFYITHINNGEQV